MDRPRTFLLALCAGLPFVHLFSACSFQRSDGAEVSFGTTLIFCDIETDRHCASNDEIMMGLDLSKPFESGFRVGKSSPIGLDYSPDALAACGGGPRALVFRDAFPTGSPVCVSAASIGPGKHLQSVNDACHAWCRDQAFYDVVDGEHVPYNCNSVAWQSNGVPQVGDPAGLGFADQCTSVGTQRPDFVDPRKQKVTTPVVWTDRVNVPLTGSDLVKLGTVSGWGRQDPAAAAGAVSSQVLNSGNGAVIITASETNLLRVFGLGTPGTSTTFEDVEFGLLVTQAGTLLVVESGVIRANPHPAPDAPNQNVITTYKTGDTLEVSVEDGLVVYRKNDLVIFQSNVAPTYPLRANAALFHVGATIVNPRVTF